eukprot:7377831-Prymnesium_polylepis.1
MPLPSGPKSSKPTAELRSMLNSVTSKKTVAFMIEAPSFWMDIHDDRRHVARLRALLGRAAGGDERDLVVLLAVGADADAKDGELLRERKVLLLLLRLDRLEAHLARDIEIDALEVALARVPSE